MGKNPHGPRGGASSSKKPPPTHNGEDTSYIVFSNAKGEPKKGKGGAKKAAEEAAKAQPETKSKKGKGKESDAPPAADEPKKPDTRTLIGGASWTGKLPVNMLSEHCQKQKWDKPEYTMDRTPAGFLSAVILRTTNPKTREKITLPPMKVPTKYRDLAAQPSALEARHFAATYALYRVANMKNIHMMMPPTYKDLWKGPFAEMKKEAVAEGAGWMYEADPFAAFEEHEKAKAAAANKREEAAKAKEQQSQNGASILGPGGSAGASRDKGWANAPKVDMGKRTRVEVERLIRKEALWNPHGIRIPDGLKKRLVDEIAALGFRRSHVEEAADICKDKEEMLEWLLIHVPEDDLPPWALPEGYVAGISMASSDLKREAAIKRLAATGYAVELCEQALDANDGDEGKAAAVLQAHLLQGEYDDDLSSAMEDASLADPDADTWAEEQAVLESIYGAEKYHSDSPTTCSLTLSIPNTPPITLHARKPHGPYPAILPILSIHAALPSYIRLALLKRALLHARTDLLHTPMLFALADWLEQEAPGIIAHPGRLSSIAAAVSAAADDTEATATRSQRTRKHKPSRPPARPLDPTPWSPESTRLHAEHEARMRSPAGQRMLAARQRLPAWSQRARIVAAVRDHAVTIVSGETGSGKSTQAVQFVVDDLLARGLGAAAHVVVTQPRRISAMGLAERVAAERVGAVGQEVGYAIKGERKWSADTRIGFVTTGVLLRQLQGGGGELEGVSHVVVDEVHERSLDGDFLLALLREVLRRKPGGLKVVLMSATLDADVFESYFAGLGGVGRCEIEGRTFPVRDFYLDEVVRSTGFGGVRAVVEEKVEGEGEEEGEGMGKALRSVGMGINYDLIVETVRLVDRELGEKDGAVLVFLPGTMEIDRCVRTLRAALPQVHALPLHASLLPTDQRKVFPPPPPGTRKVIASTNVAETSITIPDIVAVIDSGRVKETTYDPAANMVKLEEVWASRAAAKQRRGRAGRVREGLCYKLYTRNAEQTKMPERPEPEIRRTPLEGLCLSVKAMGVADVAGFLASTITPPATAAVANALDLLRRMGVLDGDALTALGTCMAGIPADLRCAKLLVYGAVFGCLPSCLTLASLLSVRSPFLAPREKRDEAKAARMAFAGSPSQGDPLADLRAFDEWAALRRKGATAADLRRWCEARFLSHHTLLDVESNRAQYLSALQEAGFAPLSSSPETSPENTTPLPLLRALLAAALSPQLARIALPATKFAATSTGAMALDPEARAIRFFDRDAGRVFVHPSSTLFGAQTFVGPHPAFLAFFGKMGSSGAARGAGGMAGRGMATMATTAKVYLRDVVPVNPFAVLLFAGGGVEVDTLGRGLVVDGWLRLRGWARVGVLASRLRGVLDRWVRERVADPEGFAEGARGEEGGDGGITGGGEIVGLVRRLVELDGLDR